MQSRLPLPDAAHYDAAQRAIHDSILSSRGNLSGPFLAWMHSPGLASPAEQLGAFCRYGTGLAPVESELLILCVAAHHRCVGEQQIHEPIAQQAGLAPEAIAAIRGGEDPRLSEPRQRLLHTIASELLGTNRLGEPRYREGIEAFGKRGMVELVGILGYYVFVAMTLNAFEMRLP